MQVQKDRSARPFGSKGACERSAVAPIGRFLTFFWALSRDPRFAKLIPPCAGFFQLSLLAPRGDQPSAGTARPGALSVDARLFGWKRIEIASWLSMIIPCLERGIFEL
jgi:hypothetical protein